MNQADKETIENQPASTPEQPSRAEEETDIPPPKINRVSENGIQSSGIENQNNPKIEDSQGGVSNQLKTRDSEGEFKSIINFLLCFINSF